MTTETDKQYQRKITLSSEVVIAAMPHMTDGELAAQLKEMQKLDREVIDAERQCMEAGNEHALNVMRFNAKAVDRIISALVKELVKRGVKL